MPETRTLETFIGREREGSYFTLPFTMPADTESFTLRYSYARHHEVANGAFTARREVNTIDLGLIAPDGSQAGASGSDKREITLSATGATPGYRALELAPGEWRILVGAYHVAPEGVQVTYELTFTPKRLRLLKGDLHTHTLASDGVLTAEELGRHALRHGLDFIAITDHNQFSTAAGLPHIEGLTLIPGVEWTHFQGHANFLGVDRPYDEPFAANTPEEALARFASARARGALITLNHPCEEPFAFQYDIGIFPWDCLEIWNGPMRESNLRAVGLWQSLLAAGKKAPISAGSDYHRSSPFQMLGGPTLCVYARSAGPGDILAAVRAGHAYAVYAPDGPTLELTAGGALPGDTVSWDTTRELEFTLNGLEAGDVLRVVTGATTETLLQAPAPGSWKGRYRMQAPGFARVELLRAFLPGLPLLPALLSNPVWFEGYMK